MVVAIRTVLARIRDWGNRRPDVTMKWIVPIAALQVGLIAGLVNFNWELRESFDRDQHAFCESASNRRTDLRGAFHDLYTLLEGAVDSERGELFVAQARAQLDDHYPPFTVDECLELLELQRDR